MLYQYVLLYCTINSINLPIYGYQASYREHSNQTLYLHLDQICFCPTQHRGSKIAVQTEYNLTNIKVLIKT